MAKRAAFFIPYFWTPHLETDMELIHQHVNDGDEVTIYICTSELPTCFSNISHDLNICQLCCDRRRNALNLTRLTDKVQIRNFLNLTTADKELLRQYQGRKINSLEELFRVELENCPIGRNIYNEVVCIRNESEPDLVAESDYITNCVESSALVFLSMKNNLRELKPDIFYTFNGRFVVSQPAVAAAKVCGVGYALHDRSGIMNRFWLVRDHNFHSMEYWRAAVSSHWQKSSDSDETKIRLGSQWFDARANNQKLAWFSFTAEQNIDLPPAFDRNKNNIVIFNSSESEFAGMDDYRLRFHETQNEGIEKIAQALQNDDSLHVYLRVHPNLRGKNNAQTRFVDEKLKGRFRNFHVIDADAPIKTYELIRHASAVVVFGSTVGIEAVYHGTPSILLGHGWYEGLNACLIPQSHDDLIDVLRSGKYQLSEEERERRRSEAVKYGYFCQTSGTPFELFEQTDIFEMRFRGPQNYDSMVTNTALPYAEGLKKELAQRADLKQGSQLESLAATVRELEAVSDSFAQENRQLRAEIERLREALAGANVRFRHRLKHRIFELRRSFGRKLKRVLG